jgi:hypothetical protein
MADHIDRAIDDAARALTAGEPGAAFRARIVARLEDGGPSRRAWWIGAPIAAAAAIAIVVALVSGRGQTSPAAVKPAVAPVETASAPRMQRAAPRVDTSPSLEQTTAANAGAKGPPRRERVHERGAASDASNTSAVTQLAPSPLDIPSIVVEPIEGGPTLQLDQLEPIAPIAVAPLDDQDREPQNQNRKS